MHSTFQPTRSCIHEKRQDPDATTRMSRTFYRILVCERRRAKWC